MIVARRYTGLGGTIDSGTAATALILSRHNTVAAGGRLLQASGYGSSPTPQPRAKYTHPLPQLFPVPARPSEAHSPPSPVECFRLLKPVPTQPGALLHAIPPPVAGLLIPTHPQAHPSLPHPTAAVTPHPTAKQAVRITMPPLPRRHSPGTARGWPPRHRGAARTGPISAEQTLHMAIPPVPSGPITSTPRGSSARIRGSLSCGGTGGRPLQGRKRRRRRRSCHRGCTSSNTGSRSGSVGTLPQTLPGTLSGTLPGPGTWRLSSCGCVKGGGREI